ncbi:MAG TPA: hypothetical protein VFD73_03770 [Gemmatimonadales bacterium]|nr:hypothetical protein [Gemmatimonadales bacterium]
MTERTWAAAERRLPVSASDLPRQERKLFYGFRTGCVAECALLRTGWSRALDEWIRPSAMRARLPGERSRITGIQCRTIGEWLRRDAV